MAYKFQRGNARMSGSLTQEEGLTVVKGGATVTAGGVTITAGGLDLNAGGADFNNTGLTNAGAVSGVTTLGTSGAATLDSGGTGSTFGGALTTTGILKTDDTTDATSKTDGSLQTDGGLSVAKAIYNGTSATFAADSGTVTIGSSTALGVTAAGLLNVNNATEATSATDGSLQTDGGLSVVKSAVIGDDLDLLSDGAILNIGSTSKFTLTDQSANNCVMAASGARLAFGNAGEYITGDGTDMAIVSSGDVDITATTAAVSGALSSTGASTLASASGVTTIGSTTGATFSAAGILNVNNVTEATSTTDGSLQTDGGLSVAKSVVIGDDLDLLSDGAIMNIGNTSKFTLTDQAANNCVMAASGARLAFGDAGEYVTGDGTDLALVSSGDIDLTATTVEMSVGAAGVKITGTTPLLTIGDAGAEDTTLLFDGNAKDFYVALDDSADKLVIGEGSTVGTNSILTITDDTVTLGDGAAVDTNFVWDGNAADFSMGIDDDSDVLEIRHGTTPGTDAAIKIDTNGQLLTLNAAAAAVTVSADHIMFYDGGATAIPKVESIADLATAMAGAGITATNGVFSTDASSTPSSTADGTTLSEGFNYFLADLTGSTGAVVLLPATPTVGDIVYLKAKGGVSVTSTITLKRTTGAHTIDGDASQIIESPYGAISLSYVAANDWRIF
jgi:hypothetical protein